MKKLLLLQVVILFFSQVSMAQSDQTISNPFKVNCIAFTPNGKKLVTGGDEGLVQIWNDEGKLIRTIKIDAIDTYGNAKSSVAQVAITLDGKTIAAKLSNYHVYLYNTDGTLISDIKLDNSCQKSDLTFINNGATLMIVHEYFVRVDYDLKGNKVADLTFRPEFEIEWDKRHDSKYYGSALMRNGNFIFAYSLKMSKNKDIYDFYIGEYDASNKFVRTTKLNLNSGLTNLQFSYRSDDIALVYGMGRTEKYEKFYDCVIYDAVNTKSDNIADAKDYEFFKLNPDGSSLIGKRNNTIIAAGIPYKEVESYPAPYLQNADNYFFYQNYQRCIVTYTDKLPEIYSLLNEKLFTFNDSIVVADNYIFEPEVLLPERISKSVEPTYEYINEVNIDCQKSCSSPLISNPAFTAEMSFISNQRRVDEVSSVSLIFWDRFDENNMREYFTLTVSANNIVSMNRYRNGKTEVWCESENFEGINFTADIKVFTKIILKTDAEGNVNCELFSNKPNDKNKFFETKVGYISMYKNSFWVSAETSNNAEITNFKITGNNLIRKEVPKTKPKSGRDLAAYTHKVQLNTITSDSGIVDISALIKKSKSNLKMSLQNGHSLQITSLDVSPNGKILASASMDMTAKIWNREGIVLHTLNCDGRVNCVKFSPDGKYLATASGSVDLWTVTGIHLRKIPIVGVNDLAFSADGSSLAVACDEGSVMLCKSNTTEITKIPTNKNVATTVAFSPDGKTIAVGTINKKIYWFDGNGNEIKNFDSDSTIVNDIGFSNNGKLFVYSSDGTLKFLNSEGSELRKITGLKDYKGNFGKELANLTISTLREQKEYRFDISPNGKTLIAFGYDGGHKLWIFNTDDDKQKTVLNLDYQPQDVIFSADGNSFFIGTFNGKIKELDLAGKLLNDFNCIDNSIYDIFVNSNNSVVSYAKDKLVRWSPEGSVLQNISFKLNNDSVNSSAFTNEGKLVTAHTDRINIWNQTGKLEKVTKTDSAVYNSIQFSADNKYLFAGTFTGRIKTFDHDLTPITTFQVPLVKDISDIAVNADGSYIACTSTNNILVLLTQKGSLLKSFNTENRINTVGFTLNSFNETYVISDETIGPVIIPKKLPVEISPDNNCIVAFFRDRNLRIWKLDGTLLATIAPESPADMPLCISFSPDSKKIAIGNRNKSVIIRNLDGTIHQCFVGHENEVVSVKYSADGNLLYSASKDGSIRVWNIANGDCIVYYTSKNEFLNYSPDGYWDGSKNCGSVVPMVKEKATYGVDQFALKYNRPDILLQRVNLGDAELINHYKNQNKKRLRKTGFTEDQLKGELYLPQSKIVEATIQDGFCNLKLSFSDSLYTLKKYNIYVNDVPIFGAYGKALTGKIANVTDKIQLTNGTNKIEVSCINEKSFESYRALTIVNNETLAKKNLYMLAFGVSKYNNASYNLAYADKDAKDLSATVQGLKDKGYDSVFVKTIINQQVTPATIKAAKDFVKNAKPDDTFILFIAGHGMHDKDAEATYYYLTSNADVNNLKATAADFETIEDLLQGIPPRNKLFLMDACESGEIDEEDQGQMLTIATGAGINSRGFKTVASTSSATAATNNATKRTYLYQKDRYIYNDLVRRSGAIVFSSSKGGELSYERSDIENGLFTEYIMRALTTTEADKDGNGIVSTDELREYVSNQVAKASGDLQHPTVDRDNIYQKFGFEIR